MESKGRLCLKRLGLRRLTPSRDVARTDSLQAWAWPTLSEIGHSRSRDQKVKGRFCIDHSQCSLWTYNSKGHYDLLSEFWGVSLLF